VPIIFLGVISPSQVGVLGSVPPISTPKYKVWSKSTEVIAVEDPTITEKRPPKTPILLFPVRVSVNIGEPPEAAV